MVLLGIETPDMPDHQRVRGYSQFLPQRVAVRLVLERPQIDRTIVEPPPPIGLPVRSEERRRGSPAGSQAEGRVFVDPPFHHRQIHPPGKRRGAVDSGGVEMAVCDANRNSRAPRLPKDVAAEMVN